MSQILFSLIDVRRSHADPKQTALIHMARRKLGIDDNTYRAILFHYGGGVVSSKKLSSVGFDGVMTFFNGCGFRSDWNKRTFGHRAGMATPKQIALIRSLWRDWSGSGEESGLNAWIERSYHVSALRFLSAEGAGKAINGLRAMVARNRAQR